jgi:hypothetical protein
MSIEITMTTEYLQALERALGRYAFLLDCAAARIVELPGEVWECNWLRDYDAELHGASNLVTAIAAARDRWMGE